MHTFVIVVTLVVALGIIAIGIRFLLQPTASTEGFGIGRDDVRGLTAIKGDRDIASGLVILVVWLAGTDTTLGWTLIAASVAAIGDALIVLSRGGSARTAYGVHGLTAAVMIAAGLAQLLVVA